MQILLVEADNDLRKFLRKAFREEGYGVDEGDTGDRAVEHGLNAKYDCIVLDGMLPGTRWPERGRGAARAPGVDPGPHAHRARCAGIARGAR